MYLGVFDMYSIYFGFDVFLFIWVVYVTGETLCLCFYVSCFTYGTLIIDLYYEVIYGICIFMFVKLRS